MSEKESHQYGQKTSPEDENLEEANAGRRIGSKTETEPDKEVITLDENKNEGDVECG